MKKLKKNPFQMKDFEHFLKFIGQKEQKLFMIE